MRCSNSLVLLLHVLRLRLYRAFNPVHAISNITETYASARSFSRARCSTQSHITSAATSRMMGTRQKPSKLVLESSPDDKELLVFSSSFFFGEFGDRKKNFENTALIILNFPIPSKSHMLDHFWKTSGTHIAADGGANRLYEYSKELIPELIRGDLDSLDPAVRAFYETRNVSIEQDICQDTNDLDKALQVLVTRGFDRVIIYGAFGGRFDQEMASFAALYKWSPRFNCQLYLYSDETCAFLIPANTDCEIRLPFYDTHHIAEDEKNKGDKGGIRRRIGEGPTCGLIPLGCRCESIVTSGLKWDLDGTVPLEFGGLVSSSNRVMEPTVKIFSSHPLVFTAEILSKHSI